MSDKTKLSKAQRVKVRREFRRHAKKWYEQTRLRSDIPEPYDNPHMALILELAQKSEAHKHFLISLIMEEMLKGKFHWFIALNLIAGIDAAKGETTVPGAEIAWLRWGRENGYVWFGYESKKPPKTKKSSKMSAVKK